MAKSQLEQKQKRASPRRILGAVVAVTVVFLLATSVIGLAEKYIAIRKRVKSLKEEQVVLDQKKASLEENNRYIETREGQERELRTKYNVVLPGEGVVMVTNPSLDHSEDGPSTKIGKWWDSLLRGLGIRK